MAELTPMKQQYNEIKSRHEDCMLFFRLGDFYEMFDEDAKIAARELDLTLTTRDKGKPEEERTPMCGVPYHSAEAYIGRLIAKGYKVAICEQTEDPAQAKGLVRRDVIRIITPGTVTESSMLDERRSNYLAAVHLAGAAGAAAFCDVSTGEVCVASFDRDALPHLMNELGRFAPREVVLCPDALGEPVLTEFLHQKLDCLAQPGKAEAFAPDACVQGLAEQYPGAGLAELGLEGDGPAILALGALLAYVRETQKIDLRHLDRPEILATGRFMELDYTTRRNLELTEGLRSGEKRGSLLWALDKTRTPMGARLLRAWVERPLLSPVAIARRLDAVEELAGDSVTRGELREQLRSIGDYRRLVGRCVYGTANGRDLHALGLYCGMLPLVQRRLEGARCSALREIAGLDDLRDVAVWIRGAVCDEPPFSVREGGIFQTGYDEEIDRLRRLRDNGAQMVAELEQRERYCTGIKKLKVGYNKVFGYYIEVPRSAGDVQLPETYIRKQTLANCERYFTEELKRLETELQTARETLCTLEYQHFCALRDRVAQQVGRIQAAADGIARLDVFCSLAEVAVRQGYVRPAVDLSRDLQITQGRHPVVELSQKGNLFVPNDTFLNCGDDRVAIVTGPNMAGKSTYMRQTALITLMAQMGSFVPAQSAVIGIVDRVFTRIGASDDLAAGQSTFMVEMSEMAAILRHATSQSLLILDEIGRGTSTFDGMAIARAVLEHCADKRKLGAKTMFATHYHELSALEGSLPGVRNYNITAKKQGGKLIFLRKIVPGAADDSYGIEVASLAGVPESIIQKAKDYLLELESGAAAAVPAPQPAADTCQVSLEELGAGEVLSSLRRLDLNTLSPLEALNLLYEWKRKVDA